MNNDSQEVYIGAGSYWAVIVMVWFALKGAPAWLVLFAGIGNGALLPLLLILLVPFLTGVFITMRALYHLITEDVEHPNALLNAYIAYTYDYHKNLSTLSKGDD